MCARRRSLTCAQVGNPEVWSCTMSEDDVVDQSGFADTDGADRRIAVSYVVDALEGVCVHRRVIARRQSYDALQHTPANRFERARSPLASAERVAHREERSRENEPELTVSWR